MTTSMATRGPGQDDDAAPAGDDSPREASVAEGFAGIRLAGLLAFFAVVGWLFGLSVLLVIAAVVISIFLHELGHYITARRTGMKATEFFIGFGPRIWSFTRGETTYGVKAIPAGAYVKIAGMNNLEEVAAEDEPETFRRKSYPRRILVAFAGPAMNFVIAFVLMVLLTATWGFAEGPEWPRVRLSENGAAARAGLEDGDLLLSFAGLGVPEDFEDFRSVIAAQPPGEVPVVFERSGEISEVVVDLDPRVLGIDGLEWPEVGVDSGSLAFEAGLLPGDRIQEVEGKPAPETFGEFVEMIEGAGGGEILLTVERGEQRYAATLPVPEGTEAHAFLGVGEFYPEPEPVGALRAVPEAARRVADLTWQSALALGRFFSPGGLSGFAEQVVSTPVVESEGHGAPDVSSSAGSEDLPPLPPQEELPSEQATSRVYSVLGIVVIGSQLGLADAVLLLALLNVFLAVFNLVPLLPFDGGHIMVATYERLRESLARAGILGGELRDGRYFADFAKLIPVTYAVVALVVAVGLGALWLDAIDPPSVAN